MKKRLYLFVAALFGASMGFSQTPLPITEDFESESNGSTSCGATVTLTNGNFSNDPTNDDIDWTVDNGGTGSTGTGPSVDANPGTSAGKYLYIETSGSCSGGDVANLESSLMDWSGQTAVQVQFAYHMFGATQGTMHFDIRTGTNAWTMDFIPSWTDDQDVWQTQTIIVTDTAYVGKSNVQIRVRGVTGTSFTSDMAVDDFSVMTAPSCFPLSSPVTSNITNNSANLAWTDGNSAPSFLVEYGISGFSLGSGTQASTTVTSTSLSGLSANTAYDWYVRAVCTAGVDSSSWSGPITFTTECDPFTAPYFSNFDSDALDVPPACWKEYKTYGGGFVEVEDFTGTAAPFSGAQALYIYSSSGFTAGTDELMAISPMFSDLTAGDKQVRFQANSDLVSQLIIGTISANDGTGSFTPLDTTNFTVADTYEEVVVQFTTLNGYNGTDQYIALVHDLGGTFDYIRVDDFNYETIPNCPAPNSLSAANIGADSADLSWTENGTATQWEIEWGASGFTQGSGTKVTANSNPFTLSGLSAFTSYDWYVRAICGAADTSTVSSGNNFTTTLLGAQGITCATGNPSVVFSDDLEAANGWTGVGSGGTGGSFNYGTGTTPSTSTGPTGAHSGTSYLFFEASSGPDTTVLISPAIDLSAGSQEAELSFWVHAYGSDIGFLEVGVGTSASGPFTNVYTLTGQVQNSNAAPWQNVGVDLDAYVGQTIYLEFFYQAGSSFNGDMSLDLIEVTTCASCSAPSNLMVSNIGLDSANLAWTENGTATNWQIQYGPSGFSLGSGTVLNVTTNPFTLTGLTSSTGYDFYVRSICSAGDSSGYTGPTSFATLNGIPFAANFDNFGTNNLIATDGWSSQRGASNPDWRSGSSTPSTGTGPTSDNTTGSGIFLFLETSSGSAGMRDTLNSPAVSVGAAQNSLFLQYAYHMNGATMGNMEVWIQANGTWDSIAGYNGQQQANQGDPWIQASHVLTGYAGQSVTLHFIGERGSSFTGDMAIDDVSLTVAPTCFPPSAATLDALTATSATVSWTENNGATNWQIQYGPSGFTPGTGTIVNTSSNPYTITGLTANTNYDWYVRTVCAAGDTSTWISSNFFTGYCTPAPTSTDGNGITGVAFDTVNNVTGLEAGGYGDYSNFVGVTPQGTTINLDITYETGFTYVTEVWIDWNDDLDFNDTLENVYSGVSSSANPTTLNASFSVPLTAPLGQHRMRIGGADTGPPTPCYTGSWASYEDYTVMVTLPPPCLAPTNLMASNVGLTSADVSWTENNSATTWAIEYGPAGFAPGTGTSATTSSNPYSLTGLMASTAYDFYVRSICNVGDTSVAGGPLTVNTLNGVPYVQDFEGFANGGTISDEGWFNTDPGTNPQWQSGTLTTSTATGPAVDHTLGTSSGRFLFLETSSPSGSGDTDTLISTAIVVDPSQTDIVLSFWYHMYGADMGDLQAWVVHSTGADSITTIMGQQQTAQGDAWLEYNTILNGYNGDTIRIVFVGVAGPSFNSDMAIDDVSLTVASPDDIGVTDILAPDSDCGLSATDSVTVEITNFGTAAQTGFMIGYSLNGVAITPETYTGTVPVGGSVNYTFATTANLATPGLYDIEAYTLLGTDSDNANDSSFTDLFSFPVISSFPYTESFESGAGGWTQDGNTTWELGAPNNTLIDTASDGAQAWVTDLDGDYIAGESGAVYSPCFDFTNIADPYIMMDINHDIEANWDGAVLQSSIDGGATWQNVGSFGDTINWYNDASINALTDNNVSSSQDGWSGTSTGWVTAEHYLDGLGGASSVQLRVAFASDGSVFGEGMAFDNVRVMDNPPPAPYYPIATINTEDSLGVADSLNVYCATSGTVFGVDLDGNNGISFFIVDQSTGQQEGMNIFNFNDVSNYVVNEGDSIWVRGTIIQFNGLTEINPDSIQIISTGASVPAAIQVAAPSEATESQRIEVNNLSVITGSGSGGGSYNMTATNGTDTITIRVDSDTDVHDSLAVNPLVAGDTICSIIGAGSQFDNSSPFTDGYQIMAMQYSNFDRSSCVVVPPPPTPYYPIGLLNTDDANGVADSLNVYCITSGTVFGVDLDGNAGLSFYMVDMSSGQQEGINVFNFNDVSNYVVNEGDSIWVRGTIIQFNGLTEINPDSIFVLDTNRGLPTPIQVSTPDESTESQRIQVSNLRVITGSGSGGGSYNMTATNGTDTITIRVDSDTDVHDSLGVAPLNPGDTICSLIGAGGQFDNSSPFTDGYQIFAMQFMNLDTSSCQIVGINDVEAARAELNIYPNPNKGAFTVRVNGLDQKETMITVRDVRGTEIYTEQVLPQSGALLTEIDLEGAANGIYFVTLRNGEQLYHHKIIVQ